MKPTESDVISFLRFPLIVAVVLIHTDLRVVFPSLYSMPLYGEGLSLLIDVICESAVPLFFFISGYLFFRNGEFSISIYASKLHRRVFSLLIPYLLWNIIYFLVVVFMQYVKPDILFIIHKSVSRFTFTDYLWLFWDIRQITRMASTFHSCVVIQFWFLQCLMVLDVLSPLIYIGIRYLKWYFVLLVGILFSVFCFTPISGFHPLAIIAFTLGAAFAILHLSFVELCHRYALLLGALAIILYLLCNYLLSSSPDILNVLLTLTVDGFFIAVAYQLMSKYECHINTFLLGSTFFVFAAHRFFTPIFIMIARTGILPLSHPILMILYGFISVFISVLLSLSLFVVSRRLFPRFTALLVGGR
jgi:fucose 4-O-acetylase-like acetyltransferase